MNIFPSPLRTRLDIKNYMLHFRRIFLNLILYKNSFGLDQELNLCWVSARNQ